MKPIYLRNLPWKNGTPETFDHSNFIKNIAQYIQPECYLELGVRCGETFFLVSPFCKKAIAVDKQKLNIPIQDNIEVHQMLTDEYFDKIKYSDIRFDLVFIDADHSYQQSKTDFLNVIKYVIDDAIIFLHDTYPIDGSWCTDSACGTVYETILYIKENLYNDFEVLTLPIHPGLTMVKKIKRNKQVMWN